jgi:hypothetical protein
MGLFSHKMLLIGIAWIILLANTATNKIDNYVQSVSSWYTSFDLISSIYNAYCINVGVIVIIYRFHEGRHFLICLVTLIISLIDIYLSRYLYIIFLLCYPYLRLSSTTRLVWLMSFFCFDFSIERHVCL